MFPKKYDANTNSWIASRIFSDYLTPIDKKIGYKNKEILLFMDQLTAHIHNTTQHHS
jgi:hypothetical protein